MEYKPTQTGQYKIKALNPAYQSEYSNYVYILSLNETYIKLKDLFPEPFNMGVFRYICNQNDEFSVWLKGVVNEESCDMEYIYNHSGDKLLSCLVRNCIKNSYGAKFDQSYPIRIRFLNDIYNIIKMRYQVKWQKLYDTLHFEYDPLSPYHMSVDEQENKNKTQDDTTATNSSNQLESENSRQGFNSDSYQPVDKTEETNTSTGSRKLDSDIVENNDRTILRQGNIGNITRQELIEKERQVYQYQFLDSIYRDLDEILTNNYYGGI